MLVPYSYTRQEKWDENHLLKDVIIFKLLPGIL